MILDFDIAYSEEDQNCFVGWFEASVQKPTAAAAMHALLEGWINVLLAPQQIQIDQDSAFHSVFEELCRNLGRPLVHTPSAAHCTHGKIERWVRLVATMDEKVVKDMDVQVEMGS